MEAGTQEARNSGQAWSRGQEASRLDAGNAERHVLRAGKSVPGPPALRVSHTFRHIRCDEVIVEDRHRRRLQGIESLAESVGQIGVLQPIAITPARRLIAGERRLTAAKLAGLEFIPAMVLHDLESQWDLILAELMENSEREQPAYSDLADIAEDLLPLAQEAARNRQGHQSGEDSALPKRFTEAGEALDQVAALLKLSRPTLNKIRKIVAAAREDRAQFGDLVERMDVDRKVDGTYKELLRRQGLLKEKPREPDAFEGVSIHTNRKGGIRITISEDRPDGNALLKLFRAAVETFSADHPEGTRRLHRWMREGWKADAR